MKSEIKFIANQLVASLADIVKLNEQEVKDESFKLVFCWSSYSLIFLCSLHHLDMPWNITLLIKKGDIKIEQIHEMLSNNNNYQEIGRYRITPVFLADAETNFSVLFEKIKVDLNSAIASIENV